MKIYNKIFSLSVFLIIFSFVFTPAILLVQAEPGAEEPAEEELSALNKLKTVGGGAYGIEGTAEPKQPVQIIGEIIKVGLNVIGLIFLVLMIYGGFLWMTAGGEEQTLTKAKNTIEAAVIGLVIVFAAYGITYFVVYQLTKKIIMPS